MSFLRHGRSIVRWGSLRRPGAKTALRSAPVSHRHDESQPAIPGGLLSSMARFRFTGQAQNAVQWSCRSSILQRTANSVLFRCLSRGVHSKSLLLGVTINGELETDGVSPRRNHGLSFQRRFADRSICTNGLGFVIVGLSRLHEMVKTASAPNEISVDFLVLFARLSTIYVVTSDRVSGRIARRNTRLPRELHTVWLG